MRRSLFGLIAVLALASAGFAQEHGTLAVSVQTVAQPNRPAAQVSGAKVIVVHWADAQMAQTIVQDRIATTNQMGTCEIDLPPGIYDVFVTANGLQPAAYKREVLANETASVAVTMHPAPIHLRPAQ